MITSRDSSPRRPQRVQLRYASLDDKTLGTMADRSTGISLMYLVALVFAFFACAAIIVLGSASTPISDAIIVVTGAGKLSKAPTVHGFTALLIIAAGLMLALGQEQTMAATPSVSGCETGASATTASRGGSQAYTSRRTHPH